MKRSTVDFCSPEALLMKPATFAMDAFSLGRILLFLAAKDGSLWGGKDYELSLEMKEQFILDSTAEFTIGAEVAHEPARRIILQLTKKDPSLRMNLKTLQVHDFCCAQSCSSRPAPLLVETFILYPFRTKHYGKRMKAIQLQCSIA